MLNFSTLSYIITLLFIACHTSDKKPEATLPPPEIFNSKYVRLANDTNHLMMIQDVVVRYGDLYAEADSAFLEKPEKRITLYSVKTLILGNRNYRLPSSGKPVIYQLGDKEVEVD